MKLGLVITFHDQNNEEVMKDIEIFNKFHDRFRENLEIIFSCDCQKRISEVSKLISKHSSGKIKFVDSSSDAKKPNDLLFNFLNGARHFSNDVKFVYKKDPDDFLYEESIEFLISNMHLLKDVDINIIPYKTSQFFLLEWVFKIFIPFQSSALIFTKEYLDSINIKSKHVKQVRYEDVFLFLMAKQVTKTKIKPLKYYYWGKSEFTKNIKITDEFSYFSKMIDYILENNIEINKRLPWTFKFWYLSSSFFLKLKKHQKWHIIF